MANNLILAISFDFKLNSNLNTVYSPKPCQGFWKTALFVIFIQDPETALS